ncbi:MAG TPA: NAD(P)/FAD-dependent oxidoreductase, partial [Solirubrobacteraceae bacterium]
MTLRATKRGAERTSLDGLSADVLVCGASFAGLAVARELAGLGASVLVLDRYEIGERATSACAAPTVWLSAMGVMDSVRQELPCMRFSTPFGSFRYRLPWSWSSFDYRTLCTLLWAQCGEARFETAKVVRRENGAIKEGGSNGGGSPISVVTDRGVVSAPLVVDALGWRRVLGPSGYQPPDAPLSRGLEVHPHGAGGEDLDIWIERSLVPRGYLWRVPADGEQRVGAGSYEPRDHVKEPTNELAERLEYPAVRYQGN